ncbi:SNARE protein, putative [Plasmodium berghei]|uniref:SNARE protein, putative n=2 Tax=Plasmodium berghei TaxID=5821 RepID=A0A509AP60_PLABA|nr:SNARE protein, putative [Plasmodium berghei ANKA]CXI84180.1 SNARE protein, putative [Plasmodium berghei]SCM25764.1 SNARE protein, putative [Plasmodium berghei]SCN27487.1 SNARE protein, putative [Plasmodium berghei]SCO62209.1 SNARE protein, putative [Plasmodium berghei]SCO63914.1 SNARE protein, putative [Plasmodium berghei]|eukprot:XP_034423119.1 SNARE protein, putative [Plasmodium berghei ANKA]
MDIWDTDYEKTIETGKEIKKILRKNENDRKRAKNRAILRGKIAEFNQNMKFLIHQLNNNYIKNDIRYKSNEEKYMSKVEFLETMKKDILDLYEEYGTNNESNISYNITMDFVNNFDSRNGSYINEINREELMLKQHNIMRLQDEQLEFLEGTTQNLKSISYNINNEIQVHNEILDDIDRDMDETSDLLDRNSNIFTRITNNTSNYYLYMLICLLTVTLFFFIIIL